MDYDERHEDWEDSLTTCRECGAECEPGEWERVKGCPLCGRCAAAERASEGIEPDMDDEFVLVRLADFPDDGWEVVERILCPDRHGGVAFLHRSSRIERHCEYSDPLDVIMVKEETE